MAVEVESKTTRVEVETESSCDIPENCSKVMISDCFGSAKIIKSAEEIDNVGAAKDSGIERQSENKTFETTSLKRTKGGAYIPIDSKLLSSENFGTRPPVRLGPSRSKGQKQDRKELISLFESDISSLKSDIICYEENENKVLFSPKVKNRAIFDEKKTDFDAEFSTLNTVKLQPRFTKTQPCHLSTAQDNIILSSQSEEPTDSDRQVSIENDITIISGHNKSKTAKTFDIFRPKPSKKSPKKFNSGEVPMGGGASIRAQNQEA